MNDIEKPIKPKRPKRLWKPYEERYSVPSAYQRAVVKYSKYLAAERVFEQATEQYKEQMKLWDYQRSSESYKFLYRAFDSVRADYIEKYHSLNLEELEEVRAELAKHGNDVEKAYPILSSEDCEGYPKDEPTTKSYYDRSRSQLEFEETARYKAFLILKRSNERKREFASNYFERDEDKGGGYYERKDALLMLKKWAYRDANEIVDAYIKKLQGKIAKPVKSAACNGNIWNNAVLEVGCNDGEKQVWHTNCILNRSILGKLFNQWPTRRAA